MVGLSGCLPILPKSPESQCGPAMTLSWGNHGASCVILGVESGTSHLCEHRILTLNLNHSHSDSVYHGAFAHFCSEMKLGKVWRSAWQEVGIQWTGVPLLLPLSLCSTQHLCKCLISPSLNIFPFKGSYGSSLDCSFSCLATFRRTPVYISPPSIFTR